MKKFERYWFSKLINIPSCSALLCGVLASAGVSADHSSDLHWHGFFSQGAIYTDENNFFGDSTDTSFDFRDLGLGLSWKPRSDLLLSAQLIYRDAGLTSQNGVNLDYAMASYSFINRLDYGVGIRAGRVKNPYALYNETRDVATSRSSVLLPQSVYHDAFRELFHSSDSVVLYGYQSLGDWVVDFDVLKGTPNTDRRFEEALIPSSQPGRLEDDGVWGIRSIFEYDGGRIRVGGMYVHFDAQIDTVPARAPLVGIFPGELDTYTRSVFFEYNWERLQFTTEYLLMKTVYSDVFFPGVRTERESESYYFQLAYWLGEHWRVLGRYDVYYLDRKDKEGDSQLLFGFPRSDGFAKDFTVGVQYRFNEHWMLGGEVHHINGTAWLPAIENSNSSEIKKDWNLYTLQLSYKF